MKTITLFLASLMLAACSVAPESPPRATRNAKTTRIQSEVIETKFFTKWERDLLLNLWVHLVSEEVRIKNEIDSASDGNIKSLRHVLATVKAQSDETWQILFSDLR